MTLLLATALAVLSVTAVRALAAPTISLGTITLEPDTADQVVEISVTGGDEVEALSLYLQVTDGGPEMVTAGYQTAGINGPEITDVDLVTDTIFETNHTSQETVSDYPSVPQIAGEAIEASSGTVTATGVVAKVTFDTTGLTQGSYTLNLCAVNAPTVFGDVTTTLANGTLIVGEPATDVADEDNLTPTLSAGIDQTVDAGSTVYLSAGAYDPEGAELTFSWRQIKGTQVVLSHALTTTPSFVAPSSTVNTDIVLRLTASDGVHSVTDDVTIAVGESSDEFSVNAGSDKTVAAGARVQLTGTMTPDDATAVLEWTQIGGPTISFSGGNSTTLVFTAPDDFVNTVLTFQFSASDGTNEAFDTVNVTVESDDTAPTADAGANQSVLSGATVQLAGSATDPSDEGLTYSWTQKSGTTVTLSDDTLANPTFTAPTVSDETDLVFLFEATAGGQTSADTVTITVNPADTTELTVEAGSNQTVTSGDTVHLGGSYTGTDVTLVWTQTAGTSVTLSSTTIAAPTFTAPTVTSTTTLNFKLQATSNSQSVSDTVTVYVNPESSDDDTSSGSTVPLSDILNQPETILAAALILFLALLILWVLWI
jgi:hypothetical protein